MDQQRELNKARLLAKIKQQTQQAIGLQHGITEQQTQQQQKPEYFIEDDEEVDQGQRMIRNEEEKTKFRNHVMAIASPSIAAQIIGSPELQDIEVITQLNRVWTPFITLLKEQYTKLSSAQQFINAVDAYLNRVSKKVEGNDPPSQFSVLHVQSFGDLRFGIGKRGRSNMLTTIDEAGTTAYIDSKAYNKSIPIEIRRYLGLNQLKEMLVRDENIESYVTEQEEKRQAEAEEKQRKAEQKKRDAREARERRQEEAAKQYRKKQEDREARERKKREEDEAVRQLNDAIQKGVVDFEEKTPGKKRNPKKGATADDQERLPLNQDGSLDVGEVFGLGLRRQQPKEQRQPKEQKQPKKQPVKQRRIIFGGGGSLIPNLKDEWCQLGVFKLNVTALEQGKLRVLYANSGVNHLHFPTTPVSKNFVSLLTTLLNTKLVNQDLFDLLSERERLLFHDLINKSRVAASLKIRIETQQQVLIEDKMKRFQIVKGEIESGNDGVPMLTEFRQLLDWFLKHNVITKKSFNRAILELDAN